MSVHNRLLGVLSENGQDAFVRMPRFERGDGWVYEVMASNGGWATVVAARAAYQQHSVSYRGFGVGCAALVYNNIGGWLAIPRGGNVKDNPQGDINIHAEDVVREKVLAIGGTVGLLAVVGNPQPDHGSGLSPATLHPCGRCREMLPGFPGIDDRTTFISATPDLAQIEVYDLAGLQAFHEGDTSGVTGYALQSEADWDTTVGPHLVRRSLQLRAGGLMLENS